MEQNNNNISSNIFSSEGKNSGDQNKDIDSKFQSRQQEFSNEENFSQIKESAMTNELSLGQNFRNKIFMQKRLKKSINIETTQSLKSKLTIPLDLYENCNNMKIELNKFPDIITAFRTNDLNQKYYGLVGIRKLLTLQNAPIQELIDIGITAELLSLLDNSYPEFQYEALWCLTNIATGTSDQANSIVVKGGIEKINKIMDSPIEELRIQAIWLIGNLASDSHKIRDSLINSKTFDKISTILASTSENQKSLIKQSTWALSNFFRVKPTPPYTIVKKCLNALTRAMFILQDDKEDKKDFLNDSCYIFYYMTEHYKDSIKDLLDIGIIPKIIQCLDYDNTFVQLNCLRVVGNIASGNANQTQLLIDWGVLNYLKKTIRNDKKQIRKESAWILSNIAAGTQKQIETLIAENFLPILEYAIKNDDPEIKKESIWALCNLTSVENPEYLKKILNDGILRIMSDCLKMEDAKYLAVCLEGFGNLLAFGKKSNPNGPNPIVIELEKMGMFDVLEKLQLHPVEIVYEKTLKLLETYFETQNIE